MSEAVPLVDELVVLDSGSTDRTAEVAAAAGARVVHRDAILPRMPALPGKGEVLWRSLAGRPAARSSASSTPTCRDFSATSSPGSSARCSTDPDVHLVKAMYDRPLGPAATAGPAGRAAG